MAPNEVGRGLRIFACKHPAAKGLSAHTPEMRGALLARGRQGCACTLVPLRGSVRQPRVERVVNAGRRSRYRVAPGPAVGARERTRLSSSIANAREGEMPSHSPMREGFEWFSPADAMKGASGVHAACAERAAAFAVPAPNAAASTFIAKVSRSWRLRHAEPAERQRRYDR
jgi:hypothetical protein